MNPNLPFPISLLFIVTALLTVLMIYFSVRQVSNRGANGFLLIALFWLTFSGWLAYNGFYLEIGRQPIRFFLAVPVPMLSLLSLLLIRRTRETILKINPESLHYLSIVRIPVELVLWWLFLYGEIPELMTFEGRNFDILAGITAPFVAYYCFRKKTWNLRIAWVWNIISILLLINIIANALLSAPTPFQQFSFEQSSIGIFYFPIIWLPAFVAPVVLFSHIVNFMILRKMTTDA